MYNNANESESDLNELNKGMQRTDLEGNIGESRVFEKSEPKQYSEQKYREWQYSIKPISTENITDKERQ